MPIARQESEEVQRIPLHGPRIGSEFVSLKRILLRLGVEKTSAPTEILLPGTRITVLQTGQNVAGQFRVRCAKGWVSLSSESGAPLLQPSTPVKVASPNASDAVPLTTHAAVESPSAVDDGAAEEQWVVVPDPKVPAVVRPLQVPEEEQQAVTHVRTEAWVRDSAEAALGRSESPTATAANGTAGEISPRAAAQAAAAAVEVSRLQHQLAIAHMELQKLKAASGGAGVAPADLARAAVELTARASGQMDSSSVPSLAGMGALNVDLAPRYSPAIPQGAFAGGMSPFARARQEQGGFRTAPPPRATLGRPPATASPRPYRQPGQSPQRAVSRGAQRDDRPPRATSRPRVRDGSPEILGDARMVSRSSPESANCAPRSC